MFLDTIISSVRNIFRKRMRSILTIVGISIGVLSVVIISIIGEMGKVTINSELNSMGLNGIVLRSSNEYGNVNLTSNQLGIIQANSNVEAATPLMTAFMNVEVRAEPSQCLVWGIDSNAQDIVSLNLLHGRMINESDVAQNSRVCVVDQTFAQTTYKRTNIVGKKISVTSSTQTNEFTVVGVVSSGGNILQGIMGEMVPSFLYLPFSTVSQLTQSNGFSQIIIKLNSKSSDKIATSSIIQDVYAEIPGNEVLKVENLNQQKDKLNSVLDVITLILSAIGGISLLVAGLSIMTVMLVTVNERTREIGIKKSIGAKKSVILAEFMVEALLLSLFGSIIGVVIGLCIGAIGSVIVGVQIVVNPGIIAFCIIFCIIIGMVFGVYPAIKAANLKPVDALRAT